MNNQVNPTAKTFNDTIVKRQNHHNYNNDIAEREHVEQRA